MDSNKSWKRTIILFLGIQTISFFGSALVQYAITWYITLEIQSGVMITISIICGFLPTFFLSPFAGVWADRYNRKILIILADSLIAISTLILAILFFMGYDSIWLLFVVSAIRALGAGIQMPAVGAFVPQLVPEDKLTKVNATNSTIQSTVTLLSPMLSGALLTSSSIEVIFFIDVITATIAVSILLFFLNVSAHGKALEMKTISYFQHSLLEVLGVYGSGWPSGAGFQYTSYGIIAGEGRRGFFRQSRLCVVNINVSVNFSYQIGKSVDLHKVDLLTFFCIAKIVIPKRLLLISSVFPCLLFTYML